MSTKSFPVLSVFSALLHVFLFLRRLSGGKKRRAEENTRCFCENRLS